MHLSDSTEPLTAQSHQSRPISISNWYGLPTPLTTRQKLYLWIMQGIGAAFLDGGINFAIATAMYRKSPSVTMWILSENTVAGDMAVTTFIQGILTFIIVNTMVKSDMRGGMVTAFPVQWPDMNMSAGGFTNRLGRTFGGKAGLDFKLSKGQFFQQLGSTIYKGLLMSVLMFIAVWPIAIACVAPYWSSRNMRNTYTPMVIKFVYAFFLGAIQNPICAMIAMGTPEAVSQHSISATQKSNFDLEKNGVSSTMAERVPNRAFVIGGGKDSNELIAEGTDSGFEDSVRKPEPVHYQLKMR